MKTTWTRFALAGLAALSTFCTLLFMSTSNLSARTPVTQTKYLVYIGTYDKGVYGFRFDSGSGALDPLGLVGEVTNPSFLAVDPAFHHLYAVSELEGSTPGKVVSFALDRKTGKLQSLNVVDSGGLAPCYLAVDATGKMLVVANYTSGGVTAYPIQPDGSLGPLSALMTAEGSGPNKKRQEGPHAHESVIAADNQRVYVPDLGLDRIRIYRLHPADAKLTPNDPAFVQGAGGLGPRHMVFSKDSQHAYVLNELKPVVEAYSVDAANGSLQLIQTLPTLPANFTGESGGAEIRISPSGNFIYTSNRGHDSIQVFAIDHANGNLRHVQTQSTGGKTPRGFDLDPTGHFLLAGNQESNSLVLFRVDAKTGELSAAGKTDAPTPVDVLFVPAE